MIAHFFSSYLMWLVWFVLLAPPYIRLAYATPIELILLRREILS